MIIRASADIRQRYNVVSEQCKETGQPIYLTKNGEGDLVVMDIAAFEKDRQILQAQQLVLESIATRLSGAKSLSIKESKELVKAMLEAK